MKTIPYRVIHLSKKEQGSIHTITHKGTHSARTMLRARILSLSHKGKGKDTIARELAIDQSTVKRVRDRYKEGGLDRALFDAPRTGQPRKLDDAAEAHLVALACSDPPEGRARWTLMLLKKHMVKDGKVQRISDACILSYLSRRNIKPWVEKNVVHSEPHTGVQGAHGGHTHPLRQTLQSARTGHLY